MPLDALAALPDSIRYGIALVTTAVLLWWTYRRVTGDGTDPSISLSAGDGSGYFSFLVSGFVAVMFVAGGWVLGLGPEVMARPELLAIPAAFVAAHLYVEVRES
jgi:hypothetical protein